MWPSALQVDHKKPLAKPRNDFVVLKVDRETDHIIEIAGVFSNNIKAQSYTADQDNSRCYYTVEKKAVL